AWSRAAGPPQDYLTLRGRGGALYYTPHRIGNWSQAAMPEFATLLQQGNSRLFVPSAVLLGALHGLEPGHSKTMMAAFIVAIRGTVAQAMLLGLAATISHTLIVWGIALGGLYLWRGLDPETVEPYFQIASAVIIVGIALWMLWRTYREQR